MESNRRVLRGSSWYYNPAIHRSANRGRGAPDYRNINVGFRLVRVSKTPKVKKGDKEDGK